MGLKHYQTVDPLNYPFRNLKISLSQNAQKFTQNRQIVVNEISREI